MLLYKELHLVLCAEAEVDTDCEPARGKRDSSTQPATGENKAFHKPFIPNFPLLLFGLTKSRWTSLG